MMSGFAQKGEDIDRKPYYESLADKYGLPRSELYKIVCGEGKWGWGQSTSKNAKQLYGGYEDSWGPLQMYLGKGLGRDCRNALGITEDAFRTGEYEKEIADYGIKIAAQIWKNALRANDVRSFEYGNGTWCNNYPKHSTRRAQCCLSATWHGYNKGGDSCGGPPNSEKGPGGGVMNGHAPDAVPPITGERGNNGLAPSEPRIIHDDLATGGFEGDGFTESILD